MWFMGFSKANCKNCYACLRVCPVHAIKVKSDQVHIMKERCIACGRCFKVCPQDAKLIKSEREMVKHYIKGRYKVIASISPSFAAIFGENSNKLPTALKKLGFDYVEETASIADKITNEYEKYANLEDDKTYITSFCPPVNDLIQKYYPEISTSIIPIASPSIIHSRELKERYGKDIKVIFIGPCLAKKGDSHNQEAIDIALTFEELENWLKDENINIEELEEESFDYICKNKRLLPIIGGPTKNIEAKNPKKNIIQVDGIDDCMLIVKEIINGKFKNSLIEMNSCRHSCINGSGMPYNNITSYERKENLKRYANLSSEINIQKLNNDEIKKSNISIENQFLPKPIMLNQPSEEELIKILNDMGKYEISDELNCGNCGYHTCREKAISVYNNMSEVEMCIPFMREKAENLSSIIFDTTPNIIAILDKNLDIIKLNLAAQKFLDISNQKAKGLPIVMFLEEEKFKKVMESNINIYKEKTTLNFNKSTVLESIIWLEKNQVVLWIADDITKDEKQQEKMQNMKIDAISMAQKVINKQMTVAQEIASLLGETTAETKVTLTQLKNLIKEEGKIQ